MTLEQEVIALRAENAALRAELTTALKRIAEFEQGKKERPSFAKANRPKKAGPKKPRRKRKPEQNGARRRETPTQSVSHQLEDCPDCGCHVYGESVARRRQVIELPPPQPVEVTEHVVLKSWCPRCERWHTPRLDLRGVVLGHGRLGVRLISLIAYLRTELRMTVRAIRTYLKTVHDLVLSIGEIAEVLDRVREAGQPTLHELREQMRRSPVVHADETGWREDGQAGYVWTFSTPDGPEAEGYFERDQSRSGHVAKRVLSVAFKGILISDFFAGYNRYKGPHQRCWVHLLRDLHELKEKHAANEPVLQWARAVRALYDEAKAALPGIKERTDQEREALYNSLIERSQKLALQYAQDLQHPCCALAKRLSRHQDELFQFVRVDGLPADNNLAERSLRPIVVIRKISGGTRSPAGSKTRMALASLFATWRARGLNSFLACFNMLAGIA
ncbi:MAG TPA: IS66 family transposase [Anaerolineae bacterium]|nr:IS66 family transposase [Anaerolineae bacterium]